jgi:hypothetical protein
MATVVPWEALDRPEVLATLTHYQLPYAPGLWAQKCRERDPGNWPRTRVVEEVTCLRCLYHGARRRYLALQRGQVTQRARDGCPLVYPHPWHR